MLGIILTGHGTFATGLHKGITQIIGKQPQFYAVDFTDEMGIDILEKTLIEKIDQCDTSNGIIFMTDILGGSPFRTAATLSAKFLNSDVIAGTNMPLLIEMLIHRDIVDIAEFRNKSIKFGMEGMTSLWNENKKKQNKNKACFDGI